MYAIATYFPEEARRKAAAWRYERLPNGKPSATIVDWCPLGVLSQAVLPTFDYKYPTPVAASEVITRLLDDLHESRNEADLVEEDRLWNAIFDSFAEFCDDWDDGKITNLAEALGVAA